MAPPLPPNPYANQGPMMLGVNIFLIILTGTMCVLRFTSRKLSGVGFWWDDWLILAALPWIWGINICNFFEISYGFGQHVAILPADASSVYSHINYFDELIYVVGVPLIKFSILCFYRRIFPNRNIKIVSWIVVAIVVSWQIAIGLTFIFQCTPIEKAWNFTMPGTCINITTQFIANAIPNIFTDIVILLMPLPLVWKLQMRMTQKVALCGIFLTGSFVCAVSLIRLAIVVQLTPASLEDITWNYVGIGLWSAVEPSIGYVCACLPSIRYLFNFIFPKSMVSARRSSTLPLSGSNRKVTHRSSLWNNRAKRTPTDSEHSGSFRRLNDHGAGNGIAMGEMTALGDVKKNDVSLDLEEMEIPRNAIHVQNEVQLTSEQK
ncbi:hypothetical protein MMC19_006557 [Ptychographa xylographoides]|nr:hypothetical protein [Ptychographa xylographoides]